MAYEASCKSYPEAMPALPEVPGGRYFDPSFHELEMEHVWKKSWIIVAHISEFDEIGSYRLFERLDPSLIIVRSPGNQYRAFHTVCRHRGAPLILQEPGTAKRRSKARRGGKECVSTCKSRWKTSHQKK